LVKIKQALLQNWLRYITIFEVQGLAISMSQNWALKHVHEAYDSVRREVLHNILIEFIVPNKPARLIKMCLNKTYSKDRLLSKMV
jgi:hypothetical protein